ncbi:MAG: hypothetical protein H8E29_06115 [Anaerolineales bacterium]|uniref:DUF2938 domain-containing protein n=1 Tax=Candidatus Desulfolinea nitratireducens TaxID=2841698 RepID=A0A8J6NH16_9CHLR|nr:hypothetical protein [Candidatus Desulfolinea nitratireducens]
MNVIGAIIAGLAGTAALTMVMSMAPKMGMPEMDIVGMLGSMFGKANRTLGMVIHFMMGIVFVLVYAYLWSIGTGSATWLNGLIFGAVHWLIVGMAMAMIPMMHAGIKSGAVKAPGMWMTNNGGMKAFVGGLMGHMVFGLVAVLVYNLF